VLATSQDGDGAEQGSEEEDAGMYGEGQYTEEFEYTDNPADQEGAGGDADNDPQESELQDIDMQTDAPQTDLQGEEELAEDEGADGDLADVAEGDIPDVADDDLAEAAEGDVAEGDDNDIDAAEAPSDYPVSA